MSLKALQRRAREARYWLGQRALPLWADVGFVREGGVVAALQLNHRPAEDAVPGDRAAQEAMTDLLALAPLVGFDPERAEALQQRALKAADEMAQATAPSAGLPARSLKAACDELRRRLFSLASAEGEDAILARMAASRAFDTLMDDFLTPEGGWIAGYDEAGLPAATDMPAWLAGPVSAALGPLLPFGEA
jgi:hypothetical protein